MQLAIQVVFWGSMLALLHTYIFYPLLMRFWARNKRPNSTRFEFDDPELPTVSVLMSVYNEELVIAEKLQSLLRLNYPPEKLHIFIGSDCSTDGTNAIIEKFISQNTEANIHFLAFAQRRGKPPVINELAQAAGIRRSYGGQTSQPKTLQPSNPKPIFLLTDASVMLEPDTLFFLVRHFKNARIGAVDANMRSKGTRETGISRSEERYLSGEVLLKHREGLAWGTMIGPFGGCYALRAELFEPIPPHSLVDDFWLVFRVLERGFWAINDLNAICYEGATHRVSDEYRRKKRIAAGSFQNLARFRRWVLPPVTRLGFAFFSHKVLRWFGGFFLLGMFLSAGWLAWESTFFRAIFGLMLFGLAGSFLLNRANFPPAKNVAYFLAMNLALTDGFFKWLRGIQENTWQRTERT
ncbi:MAG: glycosyltransferase [Saprospiraceae bacterium]